MAMAIPFTAGQDYQLISYLDIETYLAFNRQLRQIILITLLLVGLLGSLVAVSVSRRISNPINQLAQSAVTSAKRRPQCTHN